MNNEVSKIFSSIVEIFDNPESYSEETVLSRYKAAKEFAMNYNAVNDSLKNDIQRLNVMLKEFSKDMGIGINGVRSHPLLSQYINRLEEILDMEYVDDINELQEEVNLMNQEIYELIDFESMNSDGIPYYLQKKLDLYNRLSKQVAEENDFFDSEAELDMMFPNREHDDDDDFDINDY